MFWPLQSKLLDKELIYTTMVLLHPGTAGAILKFYTHPCYCAQSTVSVCVLEQEENGILRIIWLKCIMYNV